MHDEEQKQEVEDVPEIKQEAVQDESESAKPSAKKS